MKMFLLGLLAILCRLLGIVIMGVAYIVVSVAGWVERVTEWADVQRGIPIVQVGEDKKFEDILDDFTVEQRLAYQTHTGESLASLAERMGDDWVYWDIHDWVLK